MKHLIPLFIALALTTSCKTYSDEDKKNFDKEITAYIEKNNLDCEKSSSGMYYKIIEQGDGDPIQFKDHVYFTYKGEFLDGEVFDEQKEPVDFNVDQLIGAWKEIMLKLNVGGKAFLIAPPHLGYGTHDLEDIPANSILVYNMEVTAIE